MRQKNVNDILKDHIQTIRQDVPESSSLSDKEIEEISKSLFSFIKEQMGRRDMPIIHIKYFGKFRVFPSTIQELIVENRLKLKSGTIDKETFEQRDREYRMRLIRVLLDQQNNPGKYEDKQAEEND